MGLRFCVSKVINSVISTEMRVIDQIELFDLEPSRAARFVRFVQQTWLLVWVIDLFDFDGRRRPWGQMRRSALLCISDRVQHSGDTHVTSCQQSAPKRRAGLLRFRSSSPRQRLANVFSHLWSLLVKWRGRPRDLRNLLILPRVRQVDQQPKRVYRLRIR